MQNPRTTERKRINQINTTFVVAKYYICSMQGLNRKILYRKEKEREATAKKAEPSKKEERIDKLPGWLRVHPLINISGLAAACRIDRANLTRWIKEGKIPDKHREKIERVLRDYGY